MKRKKRESKDKIISRKSRSLFFLRRYGLYVPAYAAVGIAVGALGTVLAFRLESGLKTAMTLIFFCILSAAAAADQKTQEVPGICILLLAIIGIISFFFFSELSWPERLAGFLIISVPMYLLALVVPGGFGGGDIKIMAVCGLYLGWKLIIMSFLTAVLIGGVYGILILIRNRREKKKSFAFVPFLAIGMELSMLFEQSLLKIVL